MQSRSVSARDASAGGLADHGPGTPLLCTPLFATGFLLGLALQRVSPLSLVGGFRTPAFQISMGLGLAAFGVWLFLWAVWTFRGLQTGIMPNCAASALVTTGPYRWSRNPMYVAFAAIYVGLAVAADVPWALLILPGVLVAMVYVAIRREERYLSTRFGDSFREYCRRVPRWL